MNIVGKRKIKVEVTFSEDSYDKIAFSNGVVRVPVNLVYNNAYRIFCIFDHI
jgi:hypothetical protein